VIAYVGDRPICEMAGVKRIVGKRRSLVIRAYTKTARSGLPPGLLPRRLSPVHGRSAIGTSSERIETMNALSGKVAIVTGASSGIGRTYPRGGGVSINRM
jgi:hypothetical protein